MILGGESMTLLTANSQSIQVVAASLANLFKETAVKRDLQGGNPKEERDLIRESGLLKLLIPEKFGGMGGTWRDVLYVVQTFAKVDSSLAHVYGYHFVNLITPHLLGNEKQQEFYYRETAKNDWFWGNAFNTVDIKLFARKENGKVTLNGVKTFCSGSVDSDYLIISAIEDKGNDHVIAVIPTLRDGVTVNRDWDNFGQRQTDSGSITFSNVQVNEDEILRYSFEKDEFSKLRINIANFLLNHVYLGIVEGAFEEAKKYTQTKTRPRSFQFQSAIHDTTIQGHYGEFYAQIEAARLLVDKSASIFQQLWDKGESISQAERSELNYAVAAAKVFITKAGLDITSRIFDVMGSRATSNQYRYDRYWRNLRTMTLHGQVDGVAQELGSWVLKTE